ncbi:MAG: type I phosphomannose isomerase catalytic subunit [Thermoguttaceae bacterium]
MNGPMSDLYPLRFLPVYKNYLWGGRRFESVLQRDLPSEGVYAESWEISDHPEGQSIVEAGPLKGKSLGELTRLYGEALIGRYGTAVFPLLLKYLDAHQHLSLQVHPDDRCAAEMGLADPGKTEAWYVIEAVPGSCLWAGFAGRVDRRSVEEALEAGKVDEILHRVEPRPGDCIFVPAGTVHAIGAGLLVAEIQQMSNNTFRLSDWGRTDADGKPRPLHLQEGLEAIEYSRGPVVPTRGLPGDKPGVTRLVQCDQFLLDRWQIEGQGQLGDGSGFQILTVVQGQLSVRGDVKPAVHRGQSLLIPASCTPVDIAPAGQGGVEFLVASLP